MNSKRRKYILGNCFRRTNIREILAQPPSSYHSLFANNNTFYVLLFVWSNLIGWRDLFYVIAFIEITKVSFAFHFVCNHCFFCILETALPGPHFGHIHEYQHNSNTEQCTINQNSIFLVAYNFHIIKFLKTLKPSSFLPRNCLSNKAIPNYSKTDSSPIAWMPLIDNSFLRCPSVIKIIQTSLTSHLPVVVFPFVVRIF